MPAPEDILGSSGRERGENAPRPGFEGANWFRINAGRRHNADPRWLLPVICRYGHVSRGDIGAIRIAANDSYFQVTERATQSFIKALRRATIAPEDQGMIIELAQPRDVAPHTPGGQGPKSNYRPEQAPKARGKKKPRAPKA